MSSGLVLSLIILVVLAGMLFYMTDKGNNFEPLLKGLEDLNIALPEIWLPPSPSPSTAANPFTSGNSRFSQGACGSNSDCKTGGCSGEVCTSKEGVITTCEYSDSFPNAQGLTCQCVQSVCGWQ